MFTFLRGEYKKEIIGEYRKRLLFVALVLAVPLLFFALAFLVPTYATLVSRKSAGEIAAKNTVSDKTLAENTAFESKVKELRSQMATLRQVTDKVSMLTLVEKIVAKQGENIILSGMSFRRGTDAGSIMLSGVAATRDALVAFSKSLESEPAFKKVVLPVSTLAKGTDIVFSISIDSTF